VFASRPRCPADEVFAAFNPSFLTPQRSREAVAPDGGGDAVVGAAPGGEPLDLEEGLLRNHYCSGLEDSFQRWQRQHQDDLQNQPVPAGWQGRNCPTTSGGPFPGGGV
jgi:hypothetical protein